MSQNTTKRYDISGHDWMAEESALGDYVSYDDHEAVAADLRARNAELEAALAKAHTAVPAALTDEVKRILHGIDMDECQDSAGWWETSTGAERGAKALADLLSAIEQHLRAAGQGKDGEREFVVFGGNRMGRNYLARLEADKLCLDEFAKHTNWELTSEYDEGDLIWCVNKVVGSPNDREWIEVGRGTTPRLAIDAAMKAGAHGGGKHG